MESENSNYRELRHTQHSVDPYDNFNTVMTIEEKRLSNQHSSLKYISYPYRWIIQFCFTFSLATTGIVMVGFSPVAELVSKIYDCSIILVEAQMIFFVFVFIPANFIVIQM